MADASLQQIVLDRPLHEVVVDAGLSNTFEVLNRLVVIAFESRKIADLEEELVRQSKSVISLELQKCRSHIHSRFRIVLLVPAGSSLVRLHSALLVSKLYLKELRNVLLPRRGSPKVALQRVVVDRLFKTASSILGVCLSVRLEGLGESVGGIVGLVQVVRLDCGCALERQTGFLACENNCLVSRVLQTGHAGLGAPCFCILKAFAAWI